MKIDNLPGVLFENDGIIVRDWRQVDYSITERAMHLFTAERDETTKDEIWFVEHPAVFTQGRAGKAEHLLQQSNIPVVQTDRGGQITYHGLGQLVVYPLINLKRRKLNIREFVSMLEQSLIETLNHFNITAYARADAPGVYVERLNSMQGFSLSEQKIASLGLRVSKGCTMHGLALNVDMDLVPFEYINPCGLLGMTMTDMANFDSSIKISDVKKVIQVKLTELLEQNSHN